MQHLVADLISIIEKRRRFKEKVDLKAAVHTLKKMIKEKEEELASKGKLTTSLIAFVKVDFVMKLYLYLSAYINVNGSRNVWTVDKCRFG